MITLLTTAKPFVGITRIRQLNAIRSWKQLHPDVEILLFGDGEGYDLAAAENDLVRIVDVPTSDRGCPRIDAMFMMADKMARYPVKAYVNCDIILMPDFLMAPLNIQFKEYLIVAQRWDLTVDGEMSFERDWDLVLQQKVAKEGQLMSPYAIDVFAYRGEFWQGLPPLIVGRAGYDNFLIYYCRKQHVPVVDATALMSLVHQTHDYTHIEGGKGEVWDGSEAQMNIRNAGGRDVLLSIEDADWRMTTDGLTRNWCRGDCRRAAEIQGMIRGYCGKGILLMLLEMVYELQSRFVAFIQHQYTPLLKYPFWVMMRLGGKRSRR